MESAAPDFEVISDALKAQHVACVHLSIFTFMVHDWLILFDREIEYVWRTKWSIGKVLYIVSRYMPFFDMPITIASHTAPYGALGPETCNTLYKIATWNIVFGIAISESILLLRTRAIYSKSKWVIVPLSVAYVVSVVAGITITWLYLRTTAFGPLPNDLFKGCNLVRRSPIIFFDPLMLLFFELAIVILTLRRGLRDFTSGTPLLRVVYRDGISFFLVLFGVTLSAVLALVLAPPQYSGVAAASTRVIHSIFCCRILLNLKRAAGAEGASTKETSAILFATFPEQQTAQLETIMSGARDTSRDEEVLRGRVAGDIRSSTEGVA